MTEQSTPTKTDNKQSSILDASLLCIIQNIDLSNDQYLAITDFIDFIYKNYFTSFKVTNDEIDCIKSHVFVKLLEKLRKNHFDPKKASIYSFSFTIIRNVFSNYFRVRSIEDTRCSLIENDIESEVIHPTSNLSSLSMDLS